MKKRNGFTLVELLAVIIILAIILVIAIPQILKTINDAKLGAMESSVKMVASAAERERQIDQTRSNVADRVFEYETDGSVDGATCIGEDWVTLSSSEYATCTVAIDTSGNATVSLTGNTSGKFKGMSASGTRSSASAS